MGYIICMSKKKKEIGKIRWLDSENTNHFDDNFLTQVGTHIFRIF